MSIVDKSAKKTAPAQQNLWENFLSEAAMGTSFRDSHVLLLGPRNTGKRSLINSIFQNVIGESANNNKVGSKGHSSALEYTYIQVRNPDDPENDEYVSKMNVWILDDPTMQDLLAHCLKEDTIENMIICLCLDMTEPWNALSTLSEWMNIINERIAKVLRDMPLQKQDKLREKLAQYVKTYEQPKFDEEGKLIIKKKNLDNPDEEEFDVPLPEGVLKINYGVPIIILGTKADGLEVLEKEKDGVYKLDFLQHKLRSEGLPYAATLLYISLKQNINLDIFFDYLLHRFYGFGLKYNAEVVHKDSIFIPSGYDKPKVITDTFQHIKPNDIFEEVISQPTGKKAMNKEEVATDDIQSFLTKLKVKMQASQDSNGGVQRQKSTELEQGEPGATTEPTGTTANAKPTDTRKFFAGLLDNPPGGVSRSNVESTPTHNRAPSQQVTGMNAAVPERTAGRLTTVNPSTSTSTSNTTIKPTKAEKLMEMLKK